MNLPLLCSLVLTGLCALPAPAATQKAPVLPAARKPFPKSTAASAHAVKKSSAPAKPVKARPLPATPARPAAVARKSLTLKSLFSRKTTPKANPVPARPPVAATAKKSPPVKTKKGPAMRRDPGEFLNIGFPVKKDKKAAGSSALTTRR